VPLNTGTPTPLEGPGTFGEGNPAYEQLEEGLATQHSQHITSTDNLEAKPTPTPLAGMKYRGTRRNQYAAIPRTITEMGGHKSSRRDQLDETRDGLTDVANTKLPLNGLGNIDKAFGHPYNKPTDRLVETDPAYVATWFINLGHMMDEILNPSDQGPELEAVVACTTDASFTRGPPDRRATGCNLSIRLLPLASAD
jgi:hypothetical protein